MQRRQASSGQPFLQTPPQLRIVLRVLRIPFGDGHSLVARAVELRPQGCALRHRRRPVSRVPHWLRAEQNSGPRRIARVPRFEPLTGAEVADAISALPSIGDKFRRDRVQTIQRANWRATYYESAPMSHESDDTISGGRKPECDTRIQYLIRRRIPAVLENQLSGALILVVSRHCSPATRPSPLATSHSPRSCVPPPAGGSSNHMMKIIIRVTTATTTAVTKPASGVAGTSSACYPSHLPASKFI